MISACVEAVAYQKQDVCHLSNTVSLNAVNLVSDTTTLSPDQPFSSATIRQSQEMDPVLGRVLQFKRNNLLPTGQALKAESADVRLLLRQWARLHVNEEGILQTKAGGREQLLLPKEHQPTVFRELHKEMGHLGVERTLGLIRDRFYWPQTK